MTGPPNNARSVAQVQRLRLGIYIPRLEARPAGVGIYTQEICSRILRTNPDCVFFAQEIAVVPDWLASAQVVPIASGAGNAIGAIRRLKRLAWLSKWGQRELQHHRIDVFFSPVQEGFISGSVPQVIVVHDLNALMVPHAFGRLHVAQTRYLLPKVARHSSKVIAVSHSTERDVLAHLRINANKVQVVYEGYDGSVFRAHSEAERNDIRIRHQLPSKYLCYVGTLAKNKNLITAVLALSELKKQGRRIPFVIVGRHDVGEATALKNEIEAHGLKDQVAWLGYLSRTDLAGVLSGATAFVFPSLYEGFGLAPLEALGCGVPVLASNVASLPEVIADAGILLPPSDVDQWAHAMSKIWDSDLRDWNERALAQARKFSWDDAASRIVAILQSVSQSVS